MEDGSGLNLVMQRRILTQDAGGHSVWAVREEPVSVPASQTALLLCDVWDAHWSRGATERLEAMVPRMNAVVRAMRERGAHLLHAPSDTMDFYSGHPARERMLALPPVPLPPLRDHDDPPLPIDDTDGGSDTGETGIHYPWTRQHPGIEIDAEQDGVSDNSEEIVRFLRLHEIGLLLVMGVHANMCVLHRPFGIKRMVRWGQTVALVRDLTDAMYNPARSPYVSHDEGTRLVVEYIEKFWCPTVAGEALLSK